MRYNNKRQLGYWEYKKFLTRFILDELVEPTRLAKILLKLEEKMQNLFTPSIMKQMFQPKKKSTTSKGGLMF